jgi:type VI secretion system secreted protein VgrG
MDDDWQVRADFQCTATDDLIPVVQGFEVDEALDASFVITVDLLVLDRAFDPQALLGQDVALQLERGGRLRRFAGLVTEVLDGGGQREGVPTRVRAKPAFALLERTLHSRIFQDATAPAILEAVLGGALSAYGREVRTELDGTYPTREYCVQYQESDFDFAQRLMEEEGITFAFDHEGDVEVLVLRDRNRGHPAAPIDGDFVPFEDSNLELRRVEAVRQLELTHRCTATGVALRDWDWTRVGDMTLETTLVEADDRGRTRISYEHGLGFSLTLGEYRGRAYTAEDGSRQAELRHDGQRFEAQVAEGAGEVLGFGAGTTFELVGHPLLDRDGKYLLEEVVHRGTRQEAGDGQARLPYGNEFRCRPAEATYRPPRRTPKPFVPGIQTATVTGAGSEEIDVDEHGRIAVKFPWDREGSSDARSSCRIRVAQPWAGPLWGSWWVPRVGMEVVVQFVDGDPDRPLVTGAVYNGDHRPPYTLPDEKTKSTIKSASSPGENGFNEIRFEDASGEEQIFVHAQRNYDEIVLANHSTTVGGDQLNHVHQNQQQDVDGNQTEKVGANQTVEVGNTRTVHVGGNYTETVHGSETRHIRGDVSERLDATSSRTIGGGRDDSIGGSETRTVAADRDETISGNASLAVDSTALYAVGAAYSSTATSAMDLVAPPVFSCTGPTLTFQSGGPVTFRTPSYTLASPNIEYSDAAINFITSLFQESNTTSMSAWALKLEAVGVVIGAVGFKGEVVGMAVHNTPTELFKKPSAATSEPVDVEIGIEISTVANEHE